MIDVLIIALGFMALSGSRERWRRVSVVFYLPPGCALKNVPRLRGSADTGPTPILRGLQTVPKPFSKKRSFGTRPILRGPHILPKPFCKKRSSGTRPIVRGSKTVPKPFFKN